MSTHNRRLARRLAAMEFSLDWANGAANAEFDICFRHALDGARGAVRAGETIEYTLQSKRKGGHDLA